MFKNKKNQLDEMQEQKLLHIEKNACWFAFWALLIAMVVQIIVFKEDAMSYMAGEWIVLMSMCLYLCAACMKAGIWDRRLKPDAKTNAIVSIVAGVITAAINAVTFWTNLEGSEDRVRVVIIAVIIMFFVVTGICFLILSLAAGSYKKRLKELEEAEEAEEVPEVQE